MNPLHDRRLGRAAVALGAVAALLVGCTSRSTPVTPSPTVGVASTGVLSRIDPRWVGIDDPEGAWKIVARSVFPDRQTFDLVPSDDTWEFPGQCSNCTNYSSTATLTVYERGTFDPAAVRTGQPVQVTGADGYFLAPRWPVGGVLAWQYDDNAWATAQGRSKTAGDLDRLTRLASRVNAQRSAVRFPFGLSTLPADMPLSSVYSWGSHVTLSFGGCGYIRVEVPEATCAHAPDRLSIQVEHANDFPSFREDADGRHEVYTIPVDVGGREGYLHQDDGTEAAIKVVPGVVVVFTLSGPWVQGASRDVPPTHRLEDVLADVVWAPNLTDDETTWPWVGDWAR